MFKKINPNSMDTPRQPNTVGGPIRVDLSVQAITCRSHTSGSGYHSQFSPYGTGFSPSTPVSTFWIISSLLLTHPFVNHWRQMIIANDSIDKKCIIFDPWRLYIFQIQSCIISKIISFKIREIRIKFWNVMGWYTLHTCSSRGPGFQHMTRY